MPRLLVREETRNSPRANAYVLPWLGEGVLVRDVVVDLPVQQNVLNRVELFSTVLEKAEEFLPLSGRGLGGNGVPTYLEEGEVRKVVG